jgi:hypothetical protein
MSLINRAKLLAELFLLLAGAGLAGCGPQLTDNSGESHPVKISNVEPRRDVAGQIIDAHDGCLQFFEGKFYLYGTAYGTNDGYGTENRYRVYSSPDLGQWTLKGDLLTNQPMGVYYRPYVVFNPNTKKYVLWYNWYPKGWAGQEGIATSERPTGPFSIVTTNVFPDNEKWHPGDGSLFVDEDGKGYYIFTTINDDYGVRVARLTYDYLGFTDEVSKVLAHGAESPLLFRRGDVYYALCGPLCAFCPEGNRIQSFKAPSPMGPYAPGPFINKQATNDLPLIPGQETWVARIPTPGEAAYIWMADLWGATPDKLRGHDFQFWSVPLEFSTNDNIFPLKWTASWYIAAEAKK